MKTMGASLGIGLGASVVFALLASIVFFMGNAAASNGLAGIPGFPTPPPSWATTVCPAPARISSRFSSP